MVDLTQENIILLIVALLIGVAVAWYVFVANRKTSVTRDESAPEESGARRNQSLIDSAPAAKRDNPPAASLAQPAPQPVPEPVREAEPVHAPFPAAASETAAIPVEAAEMPVTPDEVPQPPVAPSAEGTAGSADDLTRIKGVGPKLAALLREQGVNSFAQIAGWSESDIDRMDSQLGRFQGRIRRDSWTEQARLLASGDEKAYVAKFGQI